MALSAATAGGRECVVTVARCHVKESRFTDKVTDSRGSLDSVLKATEEGEYNADLGLLLFTWKRLTYSLHFAF